MLVKASNPLPLTIDALAARSHPSAGNPRRLSTQRPDAFPPTQSDGAEYTYTTTLPAQASLPWLPCRIDRAAPHGDCDVPRVLGRQITRPCNQCAPRVQAPADYTYTAMAQPAEQQNYQYTATAQVHPTSFCPEVYSSLIGCTSCIVKSFRSRGSFISSPH